MRSLPFFKLSPGGNPTLLFVAHLGVEEQALVATECLKALHIDAEQAGFVHPYEARLRMAGGEFCLNATRCLGLVLALQGRLPALPAKDRLPVLPAKDANTVIPDQWRGNAYTSGIAHPVTLHVETCGDTYDCTVELPLPTPHFSQSSSSLCSDVEPGVVLVRLPGISHLLIDATRHPFPHDWRRASAAWRSRYELDTEDAAGCVWWKAHEAAQTVKVSSASPPLPCWSCEPVVAVRHPHTVCHESACGSGSLALALSLARHGLLPQGAASIIQPSTMPIRVCLEENSDGLFARVGGPVRLVAQGQAYMTSLPHHTGPDAGRT